MDIVRVETASEGRVLGRLPPEPPLDAVVVFRKTFSGPGDYIYVAIRSPAGWFASSHRFPNGCSWISLLEFASSEEGELPEVYLATNFERW